MSLMAAMLPGPGPGSRGWSALLGPPRAQGGLGLVGLEGTTLEPQVLEEPPGAADLRAGTDTEDLHDRVAVEVGRSEEHTSELQSQSNLVCRLLLEKKKQMS